MTKSILASVILMSLGSFALADVQCPTPNAAGSVKKSIRVNQLVKTEGAMTIITPNNKGRNLRVADTLCFSKEKLERLNAAWQTKEPVTLVVKDNQVLDILP